MPLPLKDAADKPYRPQRDGTRQVLAVSRDVAEKLSRLASVAINSVTAPGRPPAGLDGFERVLWLSVANVAHMSADLSARARDKLADAFRPEQAGTGRNACGSYQRTS